MENKNSEKEDSFEPDQLTEEEKEKARENGFILAGKTGTGKTTILNAIYNKIVGLAASTGKSVTKETSVYYYKLRNGNVVTLIDTPGLGDTDRIENKNIDKMHLNEITKVVSEQNIHIKGILFLVNFMNERFDADEQEALLNYNTLFPLKNFWKCFVVIYTHFYSDPNDDLDEEEMKVKRTKSNGEIFEQIMEKVKNVSDVISYNDLKIKYFNSYSDADNNKKKKSNKRTREELEDIFTELSKNPPLFCQIEVQHIKNHKWKENDGKEYIGEVEIIGFFDLNKKPIKERTNIIKKEEIKQQNNYPAPSYDCYVYSGARSSSGAIYYQRAEGTKKNSRYLQVGGGGIAGGALGLGITAGGGYALSALAPSLLGTAAAGAAIPGVNILVAGAAIGVAIGAGISALFSLF